MSFCVNFIFVLLLLIPSSRPEVQFQCQNGTEFVSNNEAELNPALEEYEAALVLLLGFGVFAMILAVIYNLIRRHVFNDAHNVDSAFDAGGNVSASLTAVTVAAQLLWPADLMQSATFAVKFGVAGSFWYSTAPLINMSLFPLLSFKFKTKAPGAKTYLQIILSRGGHPAHIVFCVYALLLNAVIMSTILVGGIAVLQATVKDVSPEFCLLIIVILSGSYSLIGGLGSTFYVSYFNVLVTFVTLIVLVSKIIYSSEEPFGSLEEIYVRTNCAPKVSGNRDGSRFTFISEDSGILAVQAVTYCDQANWQSRIAAKPLPGAIGILFGAFLWYSVPASIGLVTGMTYVSETALNQSIVLSVGQIDSGIVSTYMAEKAMGTNGVLMMLIMITMLTMSTGASEIMAVSSVVVYDIYQVYINPYRKYLPHNKCIICGNTKGNQDAVKRNVDTTTQNADDLMCKCPPVTTCQDCKADLCDLKQSSKFPGQIVMYKCPYHGHFRTYQDSLINVKSWCMLWVSAGMIPFGLFLNTVGLDLNWLMFTGSILVVPSFPGVIMSIIWAKVTAIGLVLGSIGGFCSGITSNLLFAYLYYNGEGGFFLATSSPYAVLAGAGTGGTVSIFLTVVISLCTHKIKTKEDEDEVWQKLRNIDNPLHPWSEKFVEEFPELEGLYRPMSDQLEHLSRHGRMVSIVGFIVVVIIFVIVIPSIMNSIEVLNFEEFRGWIIFIIVWLLFAACVIIIATPLEEIYHILKRIKAKMNKKEEDKHQTKGTRDEVKSTKMDYGSTGQGKVSNLSKGQDNKAYQMEELKTEKLVTPV